MDAIFVWIETSSLSVWVRESLSIFGFPGIISIHAIGMGLVAGINAAIALRILGFASGIPLVEMKRFLPVMWIGFWLNAASGVMLLIGYPTKALTNPVFYLKLTFIALGLVALRLMSNHVLGEPGFERNPVSRNGKILALASLVCWAGAITAGRLLAYTYHRLESI
jgi:hypothetical protein